MKNNLNYPATSLAGSRTTWREFVVAALISGGYLLLSFLLIGFKTDQLFLVTIFSALYLASTGTRKFIIGFSIFIVYWIIFDYMKAFPNYAFNDVHIKSLYDMELRWFGIMYEGKLVTPNEYFLANNSTWVDIMCGLFYLCWVPVPLAFAAFLYFKNRSEFIKFSLTFLFVNILGFIVYYLYPAAPPWYIQLHGVDFYAHTPGNTAGLIRFDAFFDVQIFQALYAKSSNVFAAMPSLHSSYPLIVTFYGIKNKLGWVNIIFITVSIGIWFAAVYTSHHYILDVLAGVVIALVGILSFLTLVKRNGEFRNFISYYAKSIS
ncbi:phosphatase PAP2 family protein [Chryseosolibacter indicus]|uniref:phosphatase PAP2 family protein n=1 Tax=Chryseosolibacter indicus TaxID=2782351 RepID=UPI0020B3B9D9|nr:phosphatase PAP2 family protein [Chryseosolibacter indicus]